MNPTVMRSEGAVSPSRPSTDEGSIRGAAMTAPVAAALRMKLRRDSESGGVMGCMGGWKAGRLPKPRLYRGLMFVYFWRMRTELP